jgi:hypothetical protein
MKNIVETKVGEVDIIDGLSVQAVKSDIVDGIKCRKCALYTYTTCYDVKCLSNERKDNNNIIYVLHS